MSREIERILQKADKLSDPKSLAKLRHPRYFLFIALSENPKDMNLALIKAAASCENRLLGPGST